MSTREQVKRLREQEPRIRAVELARQLGVSRARIRAILITEHLPTKVEAPRFKCMVCDVSMDRSIKFCSKECRYRYFYRSLNCPQCGKEVTLQNSTVKKKLARGEMSFCSHSCRQTWFWANYPERMIGKRKNGIAA